MEKVFQQEDVYLQTEEHPVSRVDKLAYQLKSNLPADCVQLYEQTMDAVTKLCKEYMYQIFKRGFFQGLKLWVLEES